MPLIVAGVPKLTFSSVQKAGGALKQFVGPIYQSVLFFLSHPIHILPSGGIGPFG
jgi:hypothetical protein